jgi:WD40 repeat protein
LVSYGLDRFARVWDVATQRQLSESRLPSSVDEMAFTPQTNQLVTLSTDRTIRFWNMNSWNMINSFEMDGLVDDFAVSQDEQWLITIINRNTIFVWNLPSNRVDKVITVDDNLEGHIALSPDGKWLAVPVSSEVWIYDTDSWSIEHKLESNETVFSVEDVEFSPNGRYLAAGDFFDKPHIWEVENGRLRVKMEDINTAEMLLFTPDGEHLITAGGPYSPTGRGSPGNVIRIWEVFEGDEADGIAAEPEDSAETINQ